MRLVADIVRAVFHFLATSELLGLKGERPSQNHRWRFY